MTYEQKISYIIGYNIGQNMSQEPFAFDADAIRKGIQLAFDKGQIEFTPEEINQTMTEWQQNMQAAAQEKTSSELAKNKAEGQAFLDKNKQDKDVKVTASGLQYKVVTMGTGAKPASDTTRVTVHYEGKLLDGTTFDSSYERGQTASFTLNQVISGWTEGVQLMPVGSKFIFYIPSDLAYGDAQNGSPIPPGSTLVFTVELIGIN